MLAAFMLVTLAGVEWTPVGRLDDLDDPIRYVDRVNRRFIGVKGGVYRLGTPLYENDDPDRDVPQFADRVEDCSDAAYFCKSIGYLTFPIPKDGQNLPGYRTRLVVDFRRGADGSILASAVCPEWISPRDGGGCLLSSERPFPEMTFQYRLDAKGMIDYISEQHWAKDGRLSYAENLFLESVEGLRLE